MVELYLLITFYFQYLKAFLNILWFTWYYKVVSIVIGSVYWFLKIWIYIVELYLFDYFISFICWTWKLNENFQEILASYHCFCLFLKSLRLSPFVWMKKMDRFDMVCLLYIWLCHLICMFMKLSGYELLCLKFLSLCVILFPWFLPIS